MNAEFRIKKDDKRTAPKTIKLVKVGGIGALDNVYWTAEEIFKEYKENNKLDEYCEYSVEITIITEMYFS